MEDVRDSKECKQQAIEFDLKKFKSPFRCGLADFRSSPSAYRDGFRSSYCCQVKYSEKQIGFSHGNSNNLHLLSNSLLAKTWFSIGNRIFSSTAIGTTSMVQVLPNGKSLAFDYLKSRQRRCYSSKILKELGFCCDRN